MFLGRQQLQGWKRSWDHWQHHMLWLEIWVPILWSGNETPFLWYAANVSLVMQWSCTTRHHAATPIYTFLSLHYTLFEFLCILWFCLMMVSSWPTLIICSWTLPKVMAVVPITEQIPVVGTKSSGRVWWCYISCCFLCCACEWIPVNSLTFKPECATQTHELFMETVLSVYYADSSSGKNV